MNVTVKLTAILAVGLSLCYSKDVLKSGTSFLLNRPNYNDTTVKQFKRHGFLYIDTKIKNKIISRSVYSGYKLFYRYPVTRGNIGKGVIKLSSGNSFLKVGVNDTIQFTGYALPPMNMIAYLKGGQLSRLSDSSYLVKSYSPIGSSTTFVIMASDNYEEIKNRNSVSVDSLVLIVK
jgi:hypothetical protein